jgi:hypothetical protein
MRKLFKAKPKPGCLIAIVVVLVAIRICVFDSYISSNPLNFASKAVRVGIPKGTTVIIDDYSEPSFPTGDGYSFTVLQIPPDKINEFINSLKKSTDWKPLPLPKELAENERFLQPTIMASVNGEIPIASATGYYIFIDEQKEENRQSPEMATPFYERYSFNYRFGLFNDKDGRLYIWSIDT